jgi:type II secretory pathway component PulJ
MGAQVMLMGYARVLKSMDRRQWRRGATPCWGGGTPACEYEDLAWGATRPL